MDGRTFDDLTRSFARRLNRRRFLAGGAAFAGLAGGARRASPADATRRGQPPTTTICLPDGAGGYTRTTVKTILVSGYLANGAVRDNGCCSAGDCPGDSVCSSAVCNVQSGACEVLYVADDTECTPEGPINLCSTPYVCRQGICSEGYRVCAQVFGNCTELIGCNPATGLCEYGPAPDGTGCLRGLGCAQGICQGGSCFDPAPPECPASNFCRSCGIDPCQNTCACTVVGCGPRVPGCETARCDPDVGCVYTNINEGGACTIGGIPVGICIAGVCELQS